MREPQGEQPESVSQHVASCVNVWFSSKWDACSYSPKGCHQATTCELSKRSLQGQELTRLPVGVQLTRGLTRTTALSPFALALAFSTGAGLCLVPTAACSFWRWLGTLAKQGEAPLDSTSQLLQSLGSAYCCPSACRRGKQKNLKTKIQLLFRNKILHCYFLESSHLIFYVCDYLFKCTSMYRVRAWRPGGQKIPWNWSYRRSALHRNNKCSIPIILPPSHLPSFFPSPGEISFIYVFPFQVMMSRPVMNCPLPRGAFLSCVPLSSVET